jgi:hypothetical protein
MKYVIVITGIRGTGVPEHIGKMVRGEGRVDVYDTIELALHHRYSGSMYIYEPRPINRKTCVAIRNYKGSGSVRYVE